MATACQSNPRTPVPQLIGWPLGALGLFVLAGWSLKVSWIKSVLPGAVEMKPNTAVCLLLTGAALALLDRPSPGPRRRLGDFLGLMVALVGCATIGEYIFGWRLGIDELLFRDTTIAYNVVPGRMSPYSAVVFAAIGIGLLSISRRSLHWLVLATAAVPFLIGGASVIGYLWKAGELVTDRFLPPVAINTAVAFLLAPVGMFAASRAHAGQFQSLRASLSSIEIKTLAGFLVTVLLLLFTGGQAYHTAAQAAESTRWISHTQEVRTALSRLTAALSEAELEQRNYLLTSDPDYYLECQRHAREAAAQAENLAQLLADNPAQLERLRSLKAAIAQHLALLQSATETFQHSGLAAAQGIVAHGQGQDFKNAIASSVNSMDSAEAALLADRQAASARERVKTLILLLLTFALAGAGYLALFSAIRREMVMRAQVEESVRRSEENLAVTLNSIGDAVLATDTERRVTWLNPVAEKLTGWSQAQAAGRSVDEIFQIVNESTRLPAAMPVDAVLASGAVHALADGARLLQRDGAEHPISDSAAPIKDKEGRIRGVVLVFRDVTKERKAQREIQELNAGLEQRVQERTAELVLAWQALRKSEEHFRLMIESVQDYAIGLLDAKGRVMSWNAGAQRMKGYAADEIIGKHFSTFYPEEDVHAGRPEEDLRVATEQGRLEREGWRVRKDGSRFYALVVLTALRDETGAACGYCKITRDMTDRKRAEDEIRALNASLEQRVQQRTRQLEEANQELEAFSYSVSHDLRAPLRHMQGYAEMLARHANGQLSEKGHRYLKTISDASVEMGQLIDDLLAFSRTSRAEMNQIRVLPEALVQDTLRGLELATNGRNIVWKIGPLPAVQGDPATLRQVFANLIGNAVKYSRRRDPAEIEIGCAGEEDGRPIFLVRDNGAGFDMKYAQKLFGVFQRLHRADEFEGTGIGLATVRRIVVRHGGRTWAEGEPERGATFYFTLPAAKAA